MKTMKKLLILTLVAVYLVTIAYSFKIESSNYDALTYFGAGGNVETYGSTDVGTGIGQTVIGEINREADPYSIFYGIFYINVSFTVPLEIQFFRINISDYGMEWMKFNWT
jgi:hypothetical protein